MKNNFKTAREAKGLTQKECADKLEISLRAWQTYEQGVSEPKQELLCKIADMFGVSLDYLLGRAPMPDPFADLGLDAASEQEMLAQYMSFKPEIRAMIMDVLIKLADSAKPEESTPEIVETTTIGAELDRRAASDGQAEETAV